MTNRILAILLVIVLPFFAQSQNLFVIKGKIVDDKDYQNIIALNIINGDTLSKAPIIGNSFSLSGQLTEPTLMILFVDDIETPIQLYTFNETIDVTIDLSSGKDLQVNQSKYHPEYAKLNELFDRNYKKINDVIVLAKEDKTKQDSLYLIYEKLQADFEKETWDFLEQNKQSNIAALIPIMVLEGFEWGLEELEKAYNTLSPSVHASVYGKELRKLIDQISIGEVGSTIPEFQQADENGNMVSINDFKGKYVLIDFWASWCNPCRMENPNIVSAYQKYKDKNFTILGVSLDNNRENWLEAIKTDKLEWKQVSDLKGWNNAVSTMFGIESIPYSIIIDPNGKIIAKNLRGEELHQFLEETLK